MSVDTYGPVAIPLSGITPVIPFYDPADANANHAKILMPVGGAVHVPVFEFGLSTNAGVDNGFFNGLTQPEVTVLDVPGTSYISLGHSADAVASIHPLTTGGSRTESVSFTEP